MHRALATIAAVLLLASRAAAEPPASTEPAAPAASAARVPAPAPAPPPPGTDRVLGGHRFIPFQTVPWPFVASRVGSDTALGGARVVLEDQSAGDTVARYRAFEQTFRAGVRILPWLGAEAQVRGALALGADDAGALALGASYEYGGALGAVVKLLDTRFAYVSVRTDLRLARIEGMLPQALLDSATVTGGEIVYDPDALDFAAFAFRLAPSLSGAFALTRFFGLQANAGFEVVRLGSGGAHDWEERLWAAGGLSLYLSKASILFGARVDHDLDPDAANGVFTAIEPVDGTRGEIEAALYYTARPELDLGVGVRRLVAGRDDRTLGTISLGYFF